MAELPAFLREVSTLIRARYPLLYLVTWEEQRVDALMDAVAKNLRRDLVEWTATRGLRGFAPTVKLPPGEETTAPLAALAAIGKLQNPAIVLLKDFHRWMADPLTVRALRELGHALKSTFTTVVIVAPRLEIPEELEKELSVIDVPLPGKDDLRTLLNDIVAVVVRNKRAVVELDAPQTDALITAAQGLTLSEAENAFAKAIARDNRLDTDDVKLLLEEKSQIVRKSGLLEYHGADARLDEIGGLASLKKWLARRGNAFSQAARTFGLPEPKGVMLLGVQGCGKSLTARAIASSWRMPLVRLDLGRIYSGLVGSSEENLRRAIRTVESLSPVVLWVDEIEKALAGANSGGGDSGVSARVFGTLLTWLQEKTKPVFVVATANRIEHLPPELLRKGRFDEIFFVDLPSEQERSDIFGIQLTKRGRDRARFPCAELAKRTPEFSGAEIEQVVVSALYDAFADGVELTPAHLATAISETKPLAVTMAEEVAKLRAWAKQRTRPAS